MPSHYTMRLTDVIAVCEQRGEGFGLEDYPIFDEAYREGLNTKIINRYLVREIGYESVEMFTHFLRTRMHEIMPRYNQLYKTQLNDFDPLITHDMRTTSASESTGAGTTSDSATTGQTSSNESESAAKSVTSDTPQTRLAGDESYATQLNESDATSTTTATADATQTSNGATTANQESTLDSHTRGFSGAPAELIAQFRAIVANYDVDIIEELDDLFMGIYFTDDANFFGGSLW